MTTWLAQADGRWSKLQLGNGPSHIGAAGCVLTSLVMAARELGVAPDMIPPHANTKCLAAGAFTGDALIVPKAALAVGLIADADPSTGTPCHPSLHGAIVKALADGVAMVRVDLNGDPQGDHTILAVRENDDGSFQCLCPAVGPMVIGADLRATVDWGRHEGEGAARHWVPSIRVYRVVGVRGVRKPVQ